MRQWRTLDLVHADAACTLWLQDVPPYQGIRTASIGRFQCADAVAGAALLEVACNELAIRGFRYVLGPLDGDTWHHYRLVIASDGSPPFLLEPHHPPFYLEAFAAGGFVPITRYLSARSDLDSRRNTAAYARRLAAAGLRVRSFDTQHAEDDLRAIYRLSLQAFRDNLFYTPITEAAFLALYRPHLPHLRPELIRLAEDAGGGLQAFIFAIPNYLEGAMPQTLIVKTYASRHPGLGGYLLDRLQTEARGLGFQQVIHALMHVDNVSRHNSAHYATPFRHYALLGRPLP